MKHGSVMFGVSLCGIDKIPNSAHYTIPVLIMHGKENYAKILETTEELR